MIQRECYQSLKFGGFHRLDRRPRVHLSCKIFHSNSLNIERTNVYTRDLASEIIINKWSSSLPEPLAIIKLVSLQMKNVAELGIINRCLFRFADYVVNHFARTSRSAKPPNISPLKLPKKVEFRICNASCLMLSHEVVFIWFQLFEALQGVFTS